MKRPLIVLTGPTAVGKTSLSISLAKAVNGEIISADSMQVYKRMDIGSAKIRKEEMQGVEHYLEDVLEPDEEFHIVKFQEMAKAAMEEIYAKGKVPILVGGTGFYIQAVTRDIDFTEAQQENTYRAELEKRAWPPRRTRACWRSWKSWQKKKVPSIFMSVFARSIRRVQSRFMPIMSNV